MDRAEVSEQTWVISAGRPDGPGEPLNAPITPASNFGIGGDFVYARDDGTPTWTALEELVGGLEGGTGCAFASGMAAIAAVFDQLHVGAKVVLPDDCYQGVAGLAGAAEARGRLSVTRLPTADTDAWVTAASDADLLWIESPSNPLLAIADVETICAARRKAGSVLAVDNTFATPLNQQPLRLGADVVVHSATKFIGGHSDLLAGVTVAADPDLAAALRASRLLGGATPGALEAYLATRGARTMAIRLERAQANAAELARRLDHHRAVSVVRYPGLPHHPGHDLATAQLKGYGAVLSFDVASGEAADRACDRIRLIQHATSLGAVESTMERRSIISGQEHLPAGLVRLSVGIESVEDLWADLDQAISN